MALARSRSASTPSSMASTPETWKPPMPTWMPRARSGRARSSARGNWFDCTPTSITMPAPAASIIAARRSGRMRVLVSSKAWMSMSTSSPRTRRSAQSLREAVERGERIRRDRRAHPLDDVAVVVVMRRLDQNEAKTPPRAAYARSSNAPSRDRFFSRRRHPTHDPAAAEPLLLPHLSRYGILFALAI